MHQQMRHGRLVEAWQPHLRSLQMLLRSATLLGAPGLGLPSHFADAAPAAGKCNRKLSRSIIKRAIPFAQAYRDWFMLANVKHYYVTAAQVQDQRAFLRDCYMRVAHLEADLALAPLLEHRLRALCVSLDAQGRLTLAPGLLAHTNGIALLSRHGFGEAIEGSAAKVFDWLGGYLAHPDGGAGVLAPGADRGKWHSSYHATVAGQIEVDIPEEFK